MTLMIASLLLATAQPPHEQAQSPGAISPISQMPQAKEEVSEVISLSYQSSPWDILSNMGSMAWPLGAILLLALTLILERSYFWLNTNGPGKANWVRKLSTQLKQSGPEEIIRFVGERKDIYSLFALSLASSLLNQDPDRPLNEEQKHAAASELITLIDTPMRRFMHVLSSTITAAPMLGILGTVIGLIDSMGTLTESSSEKLPFSGNSGFDLGPGIAQAMTTTAAGLIIALIVLFPYNAFRAQITRTSNHLERLTAAAMQNPLQP